MDRNIEQSKRITRTLPCYGMYDEDASSNLFCSGCIVKKECKNKTKEAHNGTC